MNKRTQLNSIDEAFVAQSEAWIRNQKVCIESCDIEIEMLQRRIAIYKKRLTLEKQEKAYKVATLKKFVAKLDAFKKSRL